MASSPSFALDFLRRLLCAHSVSNAQPQRDPPGHPEPEGRRSPCIVARLMGLDALPAAAEAPHAQPQQLLRRSRSASSVEGGRTPRGLGDAAPAASSLRERQAYLRAENDMFLLLSFSPEDTKKAAGDDEEEADRRRRENDRPGGGASRKQHHRRARHRKLQFGGYYDDESGSGRRECSAQGSSPVSVLEEARDYVHEESSTTTTSSSLEDVETLEEAHLSASEQQSSIRKPLHTSFVQLDDATSPAATSTTVHHAPRCSDRERRRNRRTANNKSSDATSSAPEDASGVIWQPICRLVEEDLKNTEWLTTRHDGAAVVVVAAEMGSEILDQLVYEATVELVRLCSDDAVHASPLLPSLLVPGKGPGKTNPCPINIQARQVQPPVASCIRHN